MADLSMPADPAGAADGAVVEAHDLTRVYGEGDTAVHALRGVTLEVEPARLTAVMGPSGSGKSTLMHLLAALDQPTEGHVRIAGTRLGQLSDTAITKLRREHIGFIFQFFNLLPMLTAEENIVLPLTLAGTKPEDGFFDDLLGRVGLQDRRKHRPSELSGGQPQRVGARGPGGGARGSDPLPRRRPHRQGAARRRRTSGARGGRGDRVAMIRVALRGLSGRKLRTVLTAIAIVLGVAMMSGAYVLTDTIDKAFNAIFVESYAGTDAVVSGEDA